VNSLKHWRPWVTVEHQGTKLVLPEGSDVLVEPRQCRVMSLGFYLIFWKYLTGHVGADFGAVWERLPFRPRAE
jgi:hypothetical protein